MITRLPLLAKCSKGLTFPLRSPSSSVLFTTSLSHSFSTPPPPRFFSTSHLLFDTATSTPPPTPVAPPTPPSPPATPPTMEGHVIDSINIPGINKSDLVSLQDFVDSSLIHLPVSVLSVLIELIATVGGVSIGSGIIISSLIMRAMSTPVYIKSLRNRFRMSAARTELNNFRLANDIDQLDGIKYTDEERLKGQQRILEKYGATTDLPVHQLAYMAPLAFWVYMTSRFMSTSELWAPLMSTGGINGADLTAVGQPSFFAPMLLALSILLPGIIARKTFGESLSLCVALSVTSFVAAQYFFYMGFTYALIGFNLFAFFQILLFVPSWKKKLLKTDEVHKWNHTMALTLGRNTRANASGLPDYEHFQRHLEKHRSEQTQAAFAKNKKRLQSDSVVEVEDDDTGELTDAEKKEMARRRKKEAKSSASASASGPHTGRRKRRVVEEQVEVEEVQVVQEAEIVDVDKKAKGSK